MFTKGFYILSLHGQRKKSKNWFPHVLCASSLTTDCKILWRRLSSILFHLREQNIFMSVSHVPISKTNWNFGCLSFPSLIFLLSNWTSLLKSSCSNFDLKFYISVMQFPCCCHRSLSKWLALLYYCQFKIIQYHPLEKAYIIQYMV